MNQEMKNYIIKLMEENRAFILGTEGNYVLIESEDGLNTKEGDYIDIKYNGIEKHIGQRVTITNNK